jgi:hypothetical protein
MAYFYSLAIECGTDEAAAQACAQHFENWEVPAECSLAIRAIEVSVRQATGDEHNWWVTVIPSGVSSSGVWSGEAAQTMSTAGRCLLDRLKTAPPFRFALIGVEASEALHYSEIDRQFVDDPTMADRYHGLVISEEIYKQVGSGAAFEPFATGSFWIPYRGETYAESTV